MRLRESGILDHLANQYKKNIDKCRINHMDKQSTAGNPLGFYAMVSAFIILAIGVGLSLMVFALEFVVKCSSRRQQIEPEKKPVNVPVVIKQNLIAFINLLL